MFICEAVEPDGKTCRACGAYKALTEFHGHKAAADGHRHICKPCATKTRRSWCQANPDKRATIERRSRMKRFYGITPDMFDAMWLRQAGRCDLCSIELTLGRHGHATDHDHASGQVRALLCHLCNSGLGSFKDDAELMRRAAAYVEKHRAQL